MSLNTKSKTKKLAYSLIFDALGYVSFIFPPIDIICAPLAAYLMTRMYEGTTGKIAGAVAFIEEALPGFDIIPTFTLMWLYTFVFEPKTETIIEIDPEG